MNFATSAVEEFMIAKREREEYKARSGKLRALKEVRERWKTRCEAYIDQLHQQRKQYLDAKKSNQLSKLGLEGKEKDRAAP